MGALEPLPPLALVCGGLATRMRPLTEKIPKALLEVAGEPFIDHQLRILAREGVRRVVLCTGHMGDRIAAHVGDGSRHGLSVAYSEDGGEPLGTGGALRQALPLLGEVFWVLYGDSYLDIAYRPVWESFRRAGLPALMTVLENGDRWDRSNVTFRDGRVLRYSKTHQGPEVRHIDFGLGIVSAGLLRSRPAGRFDLAAVYEDAAREGLLAGHEVDRRFYEIGSPQGLAETHEYIASRKGPNP